jgi:hypothetical protein
MGNDIAVRSATYRLLYVHPDPDSGDRVCVGLVFHEAGQDPEVVYDQKLSRVRCLAPTLDLDLLRYFLEDMDRAFRDSDNVDSVLRRYVPQVTTSKDRAVVSPITDAVKVALLERFASPHTTGPQAAEKKKTKESHDAILRFVEKVATTLSVDVRHNVTPDEIFGKPFREIAPVAVGIQTATGLVLVDGIDLHSLTPKSALRETNRVVHTFWQWGRLRSSEMTAADRPFQRVGVIANGVVPQGKNVHRFLDAHDYARDQFHKEAELTVDSSSDLDTRKLRAALMPV